MNLSIQSRRTINAGKVIAASGQYKMLSSHKRVPALIRGLAQDKIFFDI
ncbi:hypothetical protein J4731_02030 [Providencia rettgeri]|nr:hypothetical protein [Providencia rettgeri]